MNTPTTVNDLFPSKWLHADDLQGRSFELEISRISFETVRSKFDNKDVIKCCVWFVGAQKGLLLNKTQALKLASITGSEVIQNWVGTKIVLRPGSFHGKRTIEIESIERRM